jgi:hypothetical protein
MRCARQHELVFNVAQGNGSATTVENLCRLTCLYFERVFGHARLNVSHFKIVHYLEACMQYIACPVINFVQLFLCPDAPGEEPSDLVMWVYVELRYFLMSNGSVIDGPAVQANDIPGCVDMNVTGSEDSGQMRWQLVTRANAKLAVDEMFRKRGNFGHESISRLLDAVDAIASVNLPTTSSDDTADIIDMEGFLYVVAYEFNKIEHLLKELDTILFSLKTIPPFRVTTKRDIVNELAEKVQVDVPARNANISLSLDRVKSLMYQFIHNDPRRTGTLDQISFRSVVIVAGQAILSFESGRDAHTLVDESVRLFRDFEAPDSRICYADFIGQLIAHLVMEQGGTCGLDGGGAIEALRSCAHAGIGIGEKQASALVMLIGLSQCPPDSFHFWTTGALDKDLQAGADSSQKFISKVGRWSVKDKNLPLDPAFSAQSVVESDMASVSSEMQGRTPAFPGMEVKSMKLTKGLESFSMAEEEFKKSMTMTASVHQGGSSSVDNLSFAQSSQVTAKSTKKEPALLSQSQILLDDLVPLSIKEGGHNPAADFSYSNMIKTVQMANVSLSSQSQLGGMGMGMGNHDPSMQQQQHYPQQGSIDSSPYSPAPHDQGTSSREVSKPTLQAQALTVKRLPTAADKLAADEVDMLRSLQVDEEQEMARMLEIERERFSRKREMKEGHEKAMHADAKAKERKAMRFKAKEDRLRYERAEAGKASYAEAVRKEQEDVYKKYAAIMKRQEEEKERVRLIKNAKRAVENAAKEKENEVQENINMRHADKASAEFEAMMLARAEEERKKREAETAQREKEEAAKREAERKAEEVRVLLYYCSYFLSRLWCLSLSLLSAYGSLLAFSDTT